MHRPKIGSVLIAVAIGMATMIPMLASPASATGVVTECASSQYPNRFGAQSKLTVDCTANETSVSSNITIHDADNAVWHHGAARTVSIGVSPYNTSTTQAFTSGSATIHITSGLITSTDLRRPIVAYTSTGTAITKGGAFIKTVSGGTVTMSQTASSTTTTAITATIDHTYSRWLVDATCTSGVATLHTGAPGFSSADLGKSVSGGPWPSGTYISVAPTTGATSATTNNAPTANCTTNNGGDPTANPVIAATTGADKIELGAAFYGSPTPTSTPVWNADPMSLELENTTGGGVGFTCSTGHLGMTAGSLAQTGGFVSADIGLSVAVKTVSGTVTTSAPVGKITSVTNSSTVLLSPTTACPTLPAPTNTAPAKAQRVSIGVAGGGAPKNNDAMMTLGAELNLNPNLVPTQDDCSALTLEGFMVVGSWISPGASYVANSSTPKATVAQISFPTSVIAFNGFVAPEKSGENGVVGFTDLNPHYTFSFPLLPTSAAECGTKNGTSDPTDDHPLSPTGLQFNINPVTLSKTPFLPTGSGNIGDPSVRSLLPETGPFGITVQQINNTGPTSLSSNTSTCTVVGLTDDPILGSGGGCV